MTAKATANISFNLINNPVASGTQRHENEQSTREAYQAVMQRVHEPCKERAEQLQKKVDKATSEVDHAREVENEYKTRIVKLQEKADEASIESCRARAEAAEYLKKLGWVSWACCILKVLVALSVTVIILNILFQPRLVKSHRDQSLGKIVVSEVCGSKCKLPYVYHTLWSN